MGKTVNFPDEKIRFANKRNFCSRENLAFSKYGCLLLIFCNIGNFKSENLKILLVIYVGHRWAHLMVWPTGQTKNKWYCAFIITLKRYEKCSITKTVLANSVQTNHLDKSQAWLVRRVSSPTSGRSQSRPKQSLFTFASSGTLSLANGGSWNSTDFLGISKLELSGPSAGDVLCSAWAA